MYHISSNINMSKSGSQAIHQEISNYRSQILNNSSIAQLTALSGSQLKSSLELEDVKKTDLKTLPRVLHHLFKNTHLDT